MYYITTKLTYLLTCHIGGGKLQTCRENLESLRHIKVLKLCRLKSEDLSQNVYRAECCIFFLPSDLIQGQQIFVGKLEKEDADENLLSGCAKNGPYEE